MNITGISSVLDFGSKILERVIPDPVERAKAQAELLAAQSEATMQEMQARLSAINTEGGSADPWTSRSRPTFLYVFYILLVMLVIVAPFIGIFRPVEMTLFFNNVRMGFDSIPDPLWRVFIAGYLGYAGLRTIEKVKGIKPGA